MKINILGRTYEIGENKPLFSTNKIVVRNNVINGNYVQVNGEIIADHLPNDIHVTFDGDLASLDCTKATINGSIHGKVDSTSLNCQDITGDVDCTSINCGNITGNVDGTTVNCGNVSGDVDAVTVRYNKK